MPVKNCNGNRAEHIKRTACRKQNPKKQEHKASKSWIIKINTAHKYSEKTGKVKPAQSPLSIKQLIMQGVKNTVTRGFRS